MRPSTRDYLARRYQDEPKVAVYSAQMTDATEQQSTWLWALLWVAGVTTVAILGAIAA
ncbi:MAG: hypothetical protein VKJ09_10390 [Leptolyngbya sp.]|nr:hypothetical protein [Leptolyngbya sp.]